MENLIRIFGCVKAHISNNFAKFIDDAVINVGTGNDLQISHVNDVSLIRDTRAGAGATLAIGADKLFLRNKDGNCLLYTSDAADE